MEVDVTQFERALDIMPEQPLLSLISAQQHYLRHRFWHGLTCLHKLCLRTDILYEAIKLCISLGADVNAENNFKETPLMFAAKRGSCKLLALLVENGAHMETMDKAGRTVLHHAVMGGSICTVHYLHLVHGLQLDVIDDKRQSGLHIAASQGNLDMVLYLLKNGRIDPRKADAFGNLPLHSAAVHGHSKIVWEMLLCGGTDLVNFKNLRGETPAAAVQGKGFCQLETTRLLAIASRESTEGQRRPRLPYLVWVCYLCTPAALFFAGIAVASFLHLLFGGYSGSLVMVPVMLYILFLFRVHSHRIKHICGWPNPMHAGAFTAGMHGSLVVWLCALLPKMLYTEPMVCIVLLVLAPVTVYMYWALILGDPGFTRLPSQDPSYCTELHKYFSAVQSFEDKHFCTSCETIRTSSVKHCRLCFRCVSNMDHHCLFLLKCVAERNHRSFVFFISLTNVCILLFLYLSYSHFCDMYPQDFSVVIDNLLKYHTFFAYLLMLNVASSLWGLSLLWWQISYVSLGLTYYQHHSLVGNTALAAPSICRRLSNLANFMLDTKRRQSNTTLNV